MPRSSQLPMGVHLVAMVLACSAVPSSAAANDVELSREHFKRAMKLAGDGQHAAAVREFELAFEANPKTSILYNLGHEHRMLAEQGGLQEMRKSLDYYQRYLLAAPKASDRKQVEGYITELKARIETAEAEQRAARPLVAPPLESAGTRPDSVPEAALVSGPMNASDTSATAPATRGMPTWGWVLVGVGAAVLAGGAVGAAVGLSSAQGPEEPLGTVMASFR